MYLCHLCRMMERALMISHRFGQGHPALALAASLYISHCVCLCARMRLHYIFGPISDFHAQTARPASFSGNLQSALELCSILIRKLPQQRSYQSYQGRLANFCNRFEKHCTHLQNTLESVESFQIQSSAQQIHIYSRKGMQLVRIELSPASIQNL